MYICLTLLQEQKTTAIWSGNFLVFHTKLGGQLVRHRKFVLFCFGAIVVYNTNETTKVLFTVSVSTTVVLDHIRILSAPNKILCVPLVTVTLLHTIKQQLQGY